MVIRTQHALLFDWGDTLIRVFPQYPGPMSTWPRVEAMPQAVEVLASLQPASTLCLATNAADSTEVEIRAALARVGLDACLERIFAIARLATKNPPRVLRLYPRRPPVCPPRRR